MQIFEQWYILTPILKLWDVFIAIQELDRKKMFTKENLSSVRVQETIWAKYFEFWNGQDVTQSFLPSKTVHERWKGKIVWRAQ